MAIWIETQVQHVHPIPQKKIEIILMTSLRFFVVKKTNSIATYKISRSISPNDNQNFVVT